MDSEISDTLLNLGDSRDSWSPLNTMSGPQHSALTDDAFHAATALRDSLANDLHRWTLLERRLRRYGREIATYYQSVFARCDSLITRFDSLSAHDVCGTPDFSRRFASHKQDLERVLQSMTEDCEECHISTDPVAPPLPPRPRAPALAECAPAPPQTHNVGTVVASPYPAGSLDPRPYLSRMTGSSASTFRALIRRPDVRISKACW